MGSIASDNYNRLITLTEIMYLAEPNKDTGQTAQSFKQH